MKHLPIGSITETKYLDKVVYTVSLFHNRVHEAFEDRLDALELIRFHADAFLKHGETDAICVEYIHLNGVKHYLMIDTLWGNKNWPHIHEQTNFEYVASHSLYHRRWSKRRMINDRRVTSSDVLRASTNFRPWWGFTHALISALIVLFSTVFLIEAVDYLNFEGGIDQGVNIAYSFALFLSTLAATVAGNWALYICRRKLKKTGFDYSEINWRRWYKWKIWGASIALAVSGFGLFVLSAFTSDYVAGGWNLDHFKEKFDNAPQLLISLYSLYILFSLMALSMMTVIVYTIVIKKVFVKKYFLPEQKNSFRKWLWSMKIEKDIVAPEPKDFFIIDPKASEYAVSREISLSQEIRVKYAPEEFKAYKQKAMTHFRNAMNSYIELLEKKKNDNISKNNK